ncbi:F510_1955 family glycosylhydrolase [Alteribacillus bidgolensis]|uniref:Beta-barrel assembly machine subunit BamC n=1 Tax=Alteribacillus bidgolensis TaxID=930129 RepID=A0A1G8R6G0_9BACI|nr:hypothetical protein [Alteribacillus bidgolensis]SDJ12549.1 Beta-barrel assembly machine subunit BamC [Alteribacillus bidgolensis]
MKKFHSPKKNTLKHYKWPLFIFAASIFLLSGCNSNADSIDSEDIEFPHMHGIGFTEDGEQAYVPAHDGLRVLEDGEWKMAEGERHDYMGFSMVDDGFYSSGHPSASSDYGNPFGIIKSTDNGKSLEILDLYEEIDFHHMDVGYNTHTIFVFNPEPNSRMEAPGLYYSTDETETWERSALQGIQEEMTSLAAHPTKEKVLAIGTKSDVYLSEDFGDMFEPLGVDTRITAVLFGHDGSLFAAGTGESVQLLQIDPETRNIDEWQLPELETDNSILYIAQNPAEENTVVFVTEQKDIYYTENSGETWNLLAEKGESTL